jgi:hypothetical protein
MSISNTISQKSSYAAVLEVKDEEEVDYNLATSNPSLSSRSSMSSLDSNHDHTAPLELGLVINALQTSLVEQEQEEEKKSTAQQHHQTAQGITEQVELQKAKINTKKPNPCTVALSSKKLKREDTVVVDYELDHGVNEKYDDNSTSTANLIVLDNVDAKSVAPNTLTPREQEKAGTWLSLSFFFGNTELFSLNY